MYLDLNRNAAKAEKPGRKPTRFAVKVLPWIVMMTLAASAVGPSAFARGAYSSEEIHAVESDRDSQVREIRNQEVRQLKLTLNRRVPQNRRADLYFRLAEIYIEAYRSEFLLEGKAHEKRRERGAGDPFIDRSRSKPFLSLGIEACEQILKAGISFSKMDEVYYFLAFNYGELEKASQSLHYYELITQRFSASPYATEAYRELGDAAYGKHDFRKAVGYFENGVRKAKAAKGTDGEASRAELPRVMHKLAWTYYRLKQFEKAVSTMKEAVSLASQDNEKFLSLHEEAMRDMALFFTETGRVDEAIEYFHATAGDKAFFPKVLERLGKQYERNVEPAKAVQVYESLLKTNPDDEAAFRVRVKLVDLDLRRGKPREALLRLKGAKIYSEGEADTVTAAQNLRAMIRRTATESHENYRKTGNKASLVVAEEFYSGYLSLMLSKEDPRKETPEIRMYLADVKREQGKWKEASELYRQVLESGDKRYAKEAGLLWTTSLSETIKRTSTGTAKAEEPSALEREFVDAADRMDEALGEAPEGREAALRAAQVLAGYKKSQDEAIKRCKKLVGRAPKTSQALTAARLWIQLLADRVPSQQGVNLEETDTGAELKTGIEELRSNKAVLAADTEIGQGKLKAALADQESRLKVGVIASKEKERDFAGAAKGYETFAQETGKRDLAERAYANAVASYLKAGEVESLDRVAASWMKRFPDSTKFSDSLRSAATSALIQGRFDVAAALFERLGRSGKDPESLETAARIFEGNGDTVRGRKVYDQYLDLYKASPRRYAVALILGMELEKAKQDSQAATFYKYCLTGPAELEAECAARLADLYLRGQDVENGKKMLARAGGVGGAKAKSAVSPFVGYARYRQAELLEREARFEPLRLPEANLKKGLSARLQFLEPLNRSYTRAMEAGGPWAIAALDRLAAWAYRFADEVDSITPPSGISDAALKNFQASLRQVSDPLRRKAYDTWADAYRKAIESELLSPAVPALADRLADAHRPGAFRAQGFRGHFRLAGIPADGGADGSSDALTKIREKLTANAQDAQTWVDYGNLLWGQGKPGLSKLAYERALGLNRKNVSALNNRAVITASGANQEDWFKALEANEIWREAVRTDEFFLPAKLNRAAHLSYYRIFPKAKPLWEQVMVKVPSADSQAGAAIAAQGTGDLSGATRLMAKAEDAGDLGSTHFVKLYHEAARATDPRKCISLIEDMKTDELQGYEKQATESLRKVCSNTAKSIR